MEAPTGPPFCVRSALSGAYFPVELPMDEHAARNAAMTKAARTFMVFPFLDELVGNRKSALNLLG